ncbi:MAG: Sir2 family NAD-dependent protein deacetylase [Desulfobacterales bacterium]
MDTQLVRFLEDFAAGRGRLTVLTGAGISAESGIPTFRGPEGYWSVGSREYQPQEMGTYQMFRRMPWEVWRWYLYRWAVCAGAKPNAGHLALAALEKDLGDRFLLITQNVDGLHLKAGNSPERTYQIHGNINYIRCSLQCTAAIYPLPVMTPGKTRDSVISEAEKKLLKCPACGGLTRPHVLWFDETYNETHFKLESSLYAARQTDLLLVVGTSGATNLPSQVAWQVHQRGGAIVDINPEPNPFTQLALAHGKGFFVQQPSGPALPQIADIIGGALG